MANDGVGANFTEKPLAVSGTLNTTVPRTEARGADPLGVTCFSPRCLVNDVKDVAGAVRTAADLTAAVAAPIPVVGQVVAGGALVVSEGAGVVGSLASCTQWVTGDASGKECITDDAINVGTAGVGRIVAPGTVRRGLREFTAAERGIPAGVNLFGDRLGWPLGYPSSRNAGHLSGQDPCDPRPRFEPAQR